MHSPRLLVVEDQGVIALDLEDAAAALGCDVVDVVVRGEDALPAAMRHSADIAVCDINLRGAVDGIEAATALNAAGVVVMFCTAYVDEATVARARAARPVGYITKPFTRESLHASLSIAIDRARERQGSPWPTPRHR